jgi:radical SAM protein with 4Fe4S-binding SPASM domain
MVVMKHNLNHVIQTGRFLKSIGVAGFTVTRVQPALGSKNFGSLGLSPQELTSALDSVLSLKKEGLRVDSLTCYPMCLFENIERFDNSIVHRSCFAGKTAGAIGVDGGVRACAQSDVVYGNAITESIYEIWPRMKEWRDGSSLPDACQECKWAKNCGGGCRIDSIYHHGIINGLDTYAVPSNADKLEVPCTAKSSLPVDPATTLRINSNIRYREETFGVFIDCGKGVRLVTSDTAALLKRLTGALFCVNDITREYGVDQKGAEAFFGSLLAADFMQRADRQNYAIGELTRKQEEITS